MPIVAAVEAAGAFATVEVKNRCREQVITCIRQAAGNNRSGQVNLITLPGALCSMERVLAKSYPDTWGRVAWFGAEVDPAAYREACRNAPPLVHDTVIPAAARGLNFSAVSTVIGAVPQPDIVWLDYCACADIQILSDFSQAARSILRVGGGYLFITVCVRGQPNSRARLTDIGVMRGVLADKHAVPAMTRELVSQLLCGELFRLCGEVWGETRVVPISNLAYRSSGSPMMFAGFQLGRKLGVGHIPTLVGCDGLSGPDESRLLTWFSESVLHALAPCSSGRPEVLRSCAALMGVEFKRLCAIRARTLHPRSWKKSRRVSKHRMVSEPLVMVGEAVTASLSEERDEDKPVRRNAMIERLSGGVTRAT